MRDEAHCGVLDGSNDGDWRHGRLLSCGDDTHGVGWDPDVIQHFYHPVAPILSLQVPSEPSLLVDLAAARRPPCHTIPLPSRVQPMLN